MTWARAMGREACEAVARFLVADTHCRTVVDPFCGVGTMLAVANAHGLDAVGRGALGEAGRAGSAARARAGAEVGPG